MSLKETLTAYWLHIQEELLLLWLDDTTCGPLSGHHRQLVSVLSMVRIEAFLAGWHGLPGRPPCERAPSWRGPLSRRPYSTFRYTSLLIEMLSADKTLRCLCGWQRAGEVPSESTFSRAFAGVRRERFAIAVARGADPRHPFGSVLVGHISRDSTAIEAREKPAKSDKPAAEPKPKPKRGRCPRKGELRPPPPPSSTDRTPTGG